MPPIIDADAAAMLYCRLMLLLMRGAEPFVAAHDATRLLPPR